LLPSLLSLYRWKFPQRRVRHEDGVDHCEAGQTFSVFADRGVPEIASRMRVIPSSG
jgi:hypothetical protein